MQQEFNRQLMSMLQPASTIVPDILLHDDWITGQPIDVEKHPHITLDEVFRLVNEDSAAWSLRHNALFNRAAASRASKVPVHSKSDKGGGRHSLCSNAPRASTRSIGRQSQMSHFSNSPSQLSSHNSRFSLGASRLSTRYSIKNVLAGLFGGSRGVSRPGGTSSISSGFFSDVSGRSSLESSGSTAPASRQTIAMSLSHASFHQSWAARMSVCGHQILRIYDETNSSARASMDIRSGTKGDRSSSMMLEGDGVDPMVGTSSAAGSDGMLHVPPPLAHSAPNSFTPGDTFGKSLSIHSDGGGAHEEAEEPLSSMSSRSLN